MKFYAKHDFFTYIKNDEIKDEHEDKIELWYKQGHIMNDEEKKSLEDMTEKMGKAFTKKEDPVIVTEKPMEKWKKDELNDYAAKNHPDLEINSKMTQPEMVKAIKEVEQEAPEEPKSESDEFPLEE